jgi:hypothetical protein
MEKMLNGVVFFYRRVKMKTQGGKSMKNTAKYSFFCVVLPAIKGLKTLWKTSYSKETFIFIITFLLAPVFTFGLDNKDFDKYVSVSVQPYANWFFYSGYGYLDYNLEPSVFTTVELSLAYKDYLKLLFDFDINANDNFVGDLADSKAFARIAGTLGFKNLALRAAWGQIEGEAVWNDVPIPGQPQSVPVSTKYTELALLYQLNPLFTLGLMYQNYHIPVELVYGYDDDMVFNYYGAYLIMSTFNEFMHEFREEQRKKGIKFGFWFDQNVSLGIAMGEVSEEGRRRRRVGEIIAADKGSGGIGLITEYFDFPGTLSANLQWIAGICGGIKAGNFLLGFGVGYDGFAQYYFSHENYSVMLVRHGAVAKVYCSF